MQLTVDRLLWKELNLADLNNLHDLNSRPEVDDFNTLGIPENKEETLQHLKRYIGATGMNVSVICMSNGRLRGTYLSSRHAA